MAISENLLCDECRATVMANTLVYGPAGLCPKCAGLFDATLEVELGASPRDAKIILNGNDISDRFSNRLQSISIKLEAAGLLRVSFATLAWGKVRFKVHGEIETVEECEA